MANSKRKIRIQVNKNECNMERKANKKSERIEKRFPGAEPEIRKSWIQKSFWNFTKNESICVMVRERRMT